MSVDEQATSGRQVHQPTVSEDSLKRSKRARRLAFLLSNLSIDTHGKVR